jgi:hypothetical protein
MENQGTTETQVSSNNEPIYTRFAKERDEWSLKVQDMAERLKDIYKLSDLLTDLYSYRQIALEYTHTLMSHLSKLNATFRVKKVERYDYYSRGYDLRLDKDPKNDHINADLNLIVERRELLQNHLDYFRSTVGTIDSMCFGIKHRMALEEYKRG